MSLSMPVPRACEPSGPVVIRQVLDFGEVTFRGQWYIAGGDARRPAYLWPDGQWRDGCCEYAADGSIAAHAYYESEAAALRNHRNHLRQRAAD